MIYICCEIHYKSPYRLDYNEEYANIYSIYGVFKLMVSIRLPAALRSYTGGQAVVVIQGGTVREVLANLVRDHPGLRPHVIDGSGHLRPYVNIFLGENNIMDLQGLETLLGPDDRLMLIPNIAGG